MQTFKNLGTVKEGTKQTIVITPSLPMEQLRAVRVSCESCMSFKIKKDTVVLVYTPQSVPKSVRLMPGSYKSTKTLYITYADEQVEEIKIVSKVIKK